MGLFDFFSGKAPEEYEKEADSLFDNKAYGPAKIEYEKALDKLEKKAVVHPVHKQQLEKKLLKSRECLARLHTENGENLMASGSYAEAEELFHLAGELTEDKMFMAEIEKKLDEISDYADAPDDNDTYYYDLQNDEEEDDEAYDPGEDDEYFTALCGSLPEPEQEAYLGYGDAFKSGYIALNQGDFDTAVDMLSQAMEEHPSPGGFIPLELATAYLNLGNLEEAQSLLDGFMKNHPESLRSYQLMCEILWENREYAAAGQLLLTCPQDLSDSVPILILQGENLFLAGKLQEAVSFYLELMKTRGWNEHIARALAGAYEALGLNENARDIYGEIISGCQGCGSRIDPYIKQRYADTSLETGDYSTNILEVYLGLTREDPENRVHYFQKISRVYSLQGNETEARRFLAFAGKIGEGGKG